LLCVLLGAVLAAPTLSIGNPRSDRSRAADPDWQTYRNERYAFHLSYPADSRVDTHRERGVQHISISRGTPEETQTGSYHVDVLIYDHRMGHKLKGTCKELLRDARTVRIGKVQGLRGIHQEGDDENSATHAVCVESKRLDILVKAIEADPQADLADRILNSVRFGD
jgi:hypothetical protein